MSTPETKEQMMARMKVEAMRDCAPHGEDQRDAEIAALRALIAECLALNPAVTGDLATVRVWADVVRRMREASNG